MQNKTNDFTKNSMAHNIMSLAIPMTVAQLINVLYSLVDRMYIGHLAQNSTLALTGLGITFPIIMLVTAVTNLFGMGGAPLCSIARGRGDDERAEKIIGNSFAMLIICSCILIIIGLVMKKSLLYLFGASDETYPYANEYFSIYIWGSIFVMVGLGMNTFINAQGFAKKGMLTILIGAIINIILDPIFIFGLDLGIKGAAIATVIAQFISAMWVMRFLLSDKAIYRIKKSCMKLDFKLIKEIISLGFSGFVFATTGSLVQIVCNNVLLFWGGNIYVGIMTVLNSIRDVLQMTIEGIRSGAQPVLSYNYGARQYLRVRQGIKFLAKITLLYTSLAWCILDFFPEFFIHLFNSEEEMLLLGVPALHIYFLGFFMMAFQSTGQTTFISLGMGKFATFFSLFRKVILVIPLTIFLPNVWDLGVYGVFYAEMISNFVGGLACFSTMMMVVWRRLKKIENTEKM